MRIGESLIGLGRSIDLQARTRREQEIEKFRVVDPDSG